MSKLRVKECHPDSLSMRSAMVQSYARLASCMVESALPPTSPGRWTLGQSVYITFLSTPMRLVREDLQVVQEDTELHLK
ncbi:hypothetical protein CHS0354_032592, partial [Potamilus streckersoni]